MKEIDLDSQVVEVAIDPRWMHYRALYRDRNRKDYLPGAVAIGYQQYRPCLVIGWFNRDDVYMGPHSAFVAGRDRPSLNMAIVTARQALARLANEGIEPMTDGESGT